MLFRGCLLVCFDFCRSVFLLFILVCILNFWLCCVLSTFCLHLSSACKKKFFTMAGSLNIHQALRSSDAKKSDLSPSAQSAIMYGLCCQEDYYRFVSNMCSDARKYRGLLLSIIVDLLLSNGLRVSELLSIKVTDILPNGFIKVKGKKGSNARLCHLMSHRISDLYLVASGEYVFEGLSRFFVYRCLRSLGLFYSIRGSNRRAVTHAGRHFLVSVLQDSGLEVSVIQGVIGHKSINSTMYYVK